MMVSFFPMVNFLPLANFFLISIFFPIANSIYVSLMLIFLVLYVSKSLPPLYVPMDARIPADSRQAARHGTVTLMTRLTEGHVERSVYLDMLNGHSPVVYRLWPLESLYDSLCLATCRNSYPSAVFVIRQPADPTGLSQQLKDALWHLVSLCKHRS